MKTAVFKKGSRIQHFFQHLVFWLISIVLFTVVLIYIRGDFNLSDIDFKLASSILVTILLLSVSVYINLWVLIPRFFNRRRFWQFLFLELANIALFIILNYYVSYFFEGGQHPNILAEVVAEFILVLIFLIVSTLLKVMRDSITLQDVELKMKDVEKQKVEAELKALKSQVNPHFFFNTLNSLYSLSLDKSDKAPELILKLSDLMRYVIYETTDNQVFIGKQLEFLQSYVYLEQLRSPDFMRISFRVTGEQHHMKVAPLLFLAFVENAFKHAAKERSLEPFIDILIDLQEENRVSFIIENSVDPGYVPRATGGVGLVNARKQLELLYPGRHSLEILTTPNRYRVNLTLQTI